MTVEGCCVWTQAAQTILCGEGIDPVWSSILAQMTEQDDLHDLFKMRRWAMRIDDDGMALDLGPHTPNLGEWIVES